MARTKIGFGRHEVSRLSGQTWKGGTGIRRRKCVPSIQFHTEKGNRR